MQTALAILMFLHGVAHLVGFVASWQLAPLEGMPCKTTVLAGRVDLGDAGIRVMGVAWLLAAAAFFVVAAAAAIDRSWWMPATAGVALSSSLLTLLAWPDSRIGLLVNAAILAALIGIFSRR